MFYTPAAMSANRHLHGHWAHLWANREIWNTQHEAMFNANRAAMQLDQVMLQANNLQFELNGNALAGLGRDFWQEVDNQIIELRDQEIGMEMLTDLLAIQTTLPVGKTVRLYNMVGDIADDVQVTMDGQAPYTFDHTEYSNDGDPVPIFTAGYGVNWRHALGLNTVGVDIILDSQRAKLRKYYKKLVAYMLDGAKTVNVDGKPGQGLRNHRNTFKFNLGSGSGGLNIDLTTATPEQLVAFFGAKGAFGTALRTNRLDRIDVLWVSHEIWANLSTPYTISIGGGTNATITGTVLDVVMRFSNIGSIRPTYALSGNEFLGYVRRRDYVTPLVGMATGVVPLPRPMPQHNFNFQIMGAMGMQVSRDDEGLSGVFYGGVL